MFSTVLHALLGMANLAKLVEVSPEAVQSLEAKLKAPDTPLPEKYRVLFSLRNIEGKEAHEALALGARRRRWRRFAARRRLLRAAATAAGATATRARRPAGCRLGTPALHRADDLLCLCAPAALRDPSALFRHDVAFCMGQRQDPAAVEVLQAILRDTSEHAM